MNKKINYLGMDWELETKMEMFNKYEGWTMFVFYPAGDYVGKFVDVDYQSGKFKKLSDEVHIAVEDVAVNPTSLKDFNDLVVAVKGDELPETLPKWEV